MRQIPVSVNALGSKLVDYLKVASMQYQPLLQHGFIDKTVHQL